MDEAKFAIIIFSLLMGVAYTAMFNYFIITSWLDGSWATIIHFNLFGEGMLELLILFPAILIVLILGGYYFLKEHY